MVSDACAASRLNRSTQPLNFSAYTAFHIPVAKMQNQGERTQIVGQRAPAVSVVIPAYNTADYIAETLESLFGQTFKDFEAIVVNDGSPDTMKLETVLEKYADDIVYIKRPNGGAGAARNTAIQHARGEIIAFLDGDDIWAPGFLESQYSFLTANGFDMVYSNADLFGSASVAGETFMDGAPSDGVADLDALIDLRCNVLTSATLVRKSIVERAGMFENERVHAEDFHLWLRIARLGAKIGYQKKVLLKYRVRPDSLSGDGISRITRSVEVFKRAARTIDFTNEQRQRVAIRISGFESDLAVARGKILLLDGKFRDAADAFSEANRFRKSPKLSAILWLSRFMPRTLSAFYKFTRRAEIDFVAK